MTQLYIRLKCAFNKSDPDLIEIWSGLLTLIFGIGLIFPMRTFQSVSIYSALGYVMDERSWGLVFITVGLAKLLCYSYGTFFVRQAALMIMVSLWTFVSTCIAMEWRSYPWSKAPILFIFITLLIAWAYIRVGIQKNVRNLRYANGNGKIDRKS